MITLIVAFGVLIVWSIYRFNFPENPLLDELFIKPLVWLSPVLLVSKFNFSSLGFTKKNIVRNIFFGLVVGLTLSIERVFIKHLTINFSWIFVVSAFCTAVTEEIFFRGYLLNLWLKYFKSPIYAMVLNGLFFTLTHVPIAIFIFHYSGYNLFTYLLLNFTSGFVNIVLFYHTKSIYTSISNHFIWNIFSGIFK